MHRRVLGLSTLLIGFSSLVCHGGEPFLITADTTTGTPETISSSGSSLPKLVTNLIKSQSQFSSLQNRDISATLRYGGADNALSITRNAANTSATLTIPSIGFKKVFTGTDQSSLNSQIKNFAKRDGSTIYGNFIRSINETTNIGVTDGNPLAATAIFANQAYQQFGLQAQPVTTGEGFVNPLDAVATPNIRLDFNGGYSHSDSGSSYFAGGAFSTGFKFGDRVGLVFSTPFEYRNVQGASVYMIAEEVSLPILVVEPDRHQNFNWLLTPTVIGGAAGSIDLAAGGTFVGGTLTSSLSYKLNSVIFTLADEYSYFHGYPISIGQYRFDTNLDQQILKNGVKVTKFFGENLYVDAGITYTNFLDRAAVREYWSPQAGVGIRFGSNAGLRIGYAGDFSHDFVVHGGDAQIYFNY